MRRWFGILLLITVTPAAFAASGFLVGNVDLDDIFEPNLPETTAVGPTGFIMANGVDLASRYFPLADGGAAANATNMLMSNGADLNTLFARKGSIFANKMVCPAIGSDYVFVVPTGVRIIRVKLWAGGGGSSGAYRSRSNFLNFGGGGGFVQMDIPVTPGQIMVLRPGVGGYNGYGNDFPAMYPAGGRSYQSSIASGGGRSDVYSNVSGIFIVAGAGGAGGWGPYANGAPGGGPIGGVGGNANWWPDNSDPQYMSTAGEGGSQSAGGAGGTGPQGNGYPGSYLSGGNNEGYYTGPGGGDGYYGGGSGGYSRDATSAAGGGGGSNFLQGGVRKTSLQASWNTPPNTSDADYVAAAAAALAADPSLPANYGYGAPAADDARWGFVGGKGLIILRY